MTNIYLNTFDDLQIDSVSMGEIYPTGREDEPTRIALRVIRTANKEEYLKWVEEMKLSHMVMRTIDDPKLKFYFVEVLD